MHLYFSFYMCVFSIFRLYLCGFVFLCTKIQLKTNKNLWAQHFNNAGYRGKILFDFKGKNFFFKTSSIFPLLTQVSFMSLTFSLFNLNIKVFDLLSRYMFKAYIEMLKLPNMLHLNRTNEKKEYNISILKRILRIWNESMISILW